MSVEPFDEASRHIAPKREAYPDYGAMSAMEKRELWETAREAAKGIADHAARVKYLDEQRTKILGGKVGYLLSEIGFSEDMLRLSRKMRTAIEAEKTNLNTKAQLVETIEPIRWEGTLAELRYLITQLGNRGFISKVQAGKPNKLIGQHFVDKNGRAISGHKLTVSKGNYPRPKAAPVLDKILDSMALKKPAQ